MTKTKEKTLYFVSFVAGAVLIFLTISWFSNYSNPEVDVTSPEEELVEDVIENEVDVDQDWVNSYLPAIAAENHRIVLESVAPGDVVTSPLVLSGEARGAWYFEAVFPVIINDWNGEAIFQGIAWAQDEWTTEEFVPFTLTAEFENPYTPGDPEFMKRGTLILQRDNPSALPEHDASIEVPIFFSN